MEKVKITRELADELNDWMTREKKDSIIRCHAHGYMQTSLIHKIKLDELIRALYIGYEVEPEFKVGDWVKSRHGIGTGKITDIRLGYHTDFGMVAASDDIRHATPEEIATEKTRRWWKKNNRYEWELMKGDIIRKFVINGAFYEVTYVDGEYIGLFDIGRSRMETEEIDIVSGGYRVVCFADHRKDI